MQKYRDYFNIDPEYFPAVNEAVINANPDMWKKFYPHETFVRLIKNTVSVLDRKQKVSIWVEGAYGTGKSHAVLTLKKLLDASEEEAREFFENEKYHLDQDLCNNFLRIKNSGRILTVHRYGSSSIHGDQDLVLAIQESIDHAFALAGMENQGSDSLRESVIRYLSDPDNKKSFGIYVEGHYAELFGGDTVDDLIEKLGTYTDAALHILMEKIFKVAKERQIRAFTMSTKDLANWIKEIIKANDLKAIVFIWDEFTEYFYNNARNLTGFQELAEISETDPFYFILVTHASSALFSDRDQDFIKLNGRFVNPHCQISLPENIAFQLMGAAMEKNSDPLVLEEWKLIADDLESRTRESRKQVKSIARIDDKELKGILPIHPYTALLLKHISSAFDSNQRSMFDFIKNDRGDEIRGFQWFIDNYGPENENGNPFLTIDMLWEFFYDKGKDYLTHDIRSNLDYYERSGNQHLDDDEKRVLKTILLLQAISQSARDSVELFIPNSRNLDNAFEGSDMDGGAASRCAEKLERDKVLFKKPLGSGKFQFNAYTNEVSGAELEGFKEQVDQKSTTSLITEQLSDRTAITDAITFGGALKLRYELYYVSSIDFDTKIKQLRNQENENGNKIVAIVCFAKDDMESVLIGKKIRDALADGSYHMIFIDASVTPFGKDGYEQYRNDMAQSMYQRGKNNTHSDQYANNAKDALRKWKARVGAGEFIVYTAEKPEGERATSLDALERLLSDINKTKFPECLEAAYSVIDNMYTASNPKLGVKCGVNQKTEGTFLSGSNATKLDKALEGAWLVDQYWTVNPSLLISKIKIKVDSMIRAACNAENNRISIRTIYDALKAAPYGFMPCNLTAFILGFLLKEYANGSYSWSDGLTNAALDVTKLQEMIKEIIDLQNTPNPRYKDKYIVSLTPEEKSFNKATSLAFGIAENLCTSVEQTRERIRARMKEFGFPIWTLKSILENYNLSTEHAVLENLIDYYCGIANTHNLGTMKTDNDIAIEIGRICIDHLDAAENLARILTTERCTEGMLAYLNGYAEGCLPALASDIGDNGQFINVLRRKFDADAANWVWNTDTAQQKIDEVILEYEIIRESNKLIDRTNSFDQTISEWCNRCQYIRISYAAAKNYFGDLAPFLELLQAIKKAGHILDSQKQGFLDLLRLHGTAFNNFRSDQIDLFKQVCAYYLDQLSEDEIKELFQKIPTGSFTMEKSEYFSEVERIAQEYRNSLGSAKLRKLWQDKTGSLSPRAWSNDHRMPILCLVSDEELQKAQEAFATINQPHPEASKIDKAIQYLETASFYSILGDEKALDLVFSETIIKGLSVLLTDIEEIKQYLGSHITAEPYEWLRLPEVERKLRQMAEAKYARSGCNQALEKIDEMDVADVKRYLKELIKDNMDVGIAIIKSN